MQIAFKEGFAETITHVVFQPTRGCDSTDFDDNVNTTLNGPLGEGARWRGNIIKALCDWYDANPDDDPGFWLLNCPNLFALHPQELLKPVDA